MLNGSYPIAHVGRLTPILTTTTGSGFEDYVKTMSFADLLGNPIAFNVPNFSCQFKPAAGTAQNINNVNTNIFAIFNTEYQSNPTRPIGSPSIDKIQNSKLPDAIKRAMIESPIQQMNQISLNDTLDMDFIKGAKRLMEQEGVATKKQPQPQRQQSSGGNIDMGAIAVLIENTIRKVLDEKLNQILTAQTTSTINENLVLKVGDSIFKGKITGVNKAK
jgi:hypothetical protein